MLKFAFESVLRKWWDEENVSLNDMKAFDVGLRKTLRKSMNYQWLWIEDFLFEPQLMWV